MPLAEYTPGGRGGLGGLQKSKPGRGGKNRYEEDVLFPEPGG